MVDPVLLALEGLIGVSGWAIVILDDLARRARRRPPARGIVPPAILIISGIFVAHFVLGLYRLSLRY
jgi:hypothetical protein